MSLTELEDELQGKSSEIARLEEALDAARLKPPSAKVFVVTTGSYSDYRIVAIFGSREDALGFAPAAGVEDSDVSIEEYVLGEHPEGYLQARYHAQVDIDTGEEANSWNQNAELHPKDWSESSVENSPQGRFAHGLSVVSQEHAHKVAVERRQLELRLNPGAPPRTEKSTGFRTSDTFAEKVTVE